MKPTLINDSIQLPCGVIISNRLVKSAMTERLSNNNFEPTEEHERLYKKWAATGAGLLITGNVIIDRNHLESAGNVCFDDENMIPKISKWAAAAKTKNNQVWVQISHAGRQSNRFSNLQPLAPSAVQLSKMGLFGKPKAMTEEDIQQVIKGFVKAAKIAKASGFTGLQIHSAHGYLLSQFLSPITNLRTDTWGGSLENRSRLLITIIQQVRQEVGPQFPVSVKLNSSDFQKGGFTEEESLEVVKMLDKEKIDLLEISGGTYEKLAFFLLNDEKSDLKTSTQKREAYFIDFAKSIRAVSTIPLLVTGGFRSFEFCNQVLESGELDMIGMARPFLTNLDDIPDFLNGDLPILKNNALRTGIKQFDDAAEGGHYARQVIQLAKGQKVKLKMSPMISSIFLIMNELRITIKRKLGL
jgi:2,4-dienoyl-CoA reductase-like NADH-dependent reductase (Old Yellow Enzyme family)